MPNFLTYVFGRHTQIKKVIQKITELVGKTRKHFNLNLHVYLQSLKKNHSHFCFCAKYVFLLISSYPRAITLSCIFPTFPLTLPIIIYMHNISSFSVFKFDLNIETKEIYNLKIIQPPASFPIMYNS